MKYLIVIVAVAVSCVFGDEGFDTSKFDNIDVDTILKNERLLQNHFHCLLEGKGCTSEADEIRKKIPELMETCCAKCSDKQKETGKKMTEYMIKNKPEMVKKLLDKYDPDREYQERCAEHLKSTGIDLSSF